MIFQLYISRRINISYRMIDYESCSGITICNLVSNPTIVTLYATLGRLSYLVSHVELVSFGQETGSSPI